MNNTVVIGAGIAGLSAAWRLYQTGLPVTVLEQSSHVGGAIRTMHEQGCLLELGPNTFLNSSKNLWDLADSLDLNDLRIKSPEKIGKKRYIFKNNSLQSVPAGPQMLFSSILTPKGRLRLLKEPFIKPSSNGDESLASFVSRRLGDEVLHTLVTPFVSGIYAGDPEELSIKAIFPKLVEIEQKHGSIFKGMRSLKGDVKSSGLSSFKAGMATLPMAIESRLGNRIIKMAKVTKIEKINNSYRVAFIADGEERNILAKNIVCAVPAFSAARLLSNICNEVKKPLMQIPYAPIVVVHTCHKDIDVPYNLDGFGFLVPRKQRIRMLGSLWSSSLFEGRSDPGKVLFTSFLGGQLDPEICDLSNEDIMKIVQKDFSKILNIKAKPEFACITKYTHAIPQYNIGHLDKINEIQTALQPFDGIYLTGSYLKNVSVAGTIEHAETIASSILKKS